MNPPGDNVLLFDGLCNLCVGSIRFIIRHDRRALFKFASIQSEAGQKLYQAHGLDPNNLHTMLLITKTQAYFKSDAALEVARQFGGFWKLLLIFKIIPRSVRDWVYATIARNRYRWFGRRDTCLIPDPAIRERFLE
jgi:predicted DCC family thiol-disulfide oxidoreductase YuxK